MKCPECGREMADGFVKSSAFGDFFNLKNGLEWYPAEDKRKLFKLNSITLKTKGKGYYCTVCKKVFAILDKESFQ